MNYLDLYSSYPDRIITSAWNSQLEYANKNPWLNEALKQYGDELFARFAACYAELRVLPRGVRRRLQRRIARSGKLPAILPEYLQQGGRRLQHGMAWSLAGAALLLALGQGAATAATIIVTTSNPNIAADAQCSLVEAIVNANNDAATHSDCAAGSGTDTIVLPENANITLSNAYGTLSYTTYSRPVGLPPIASRITIEGNGTIISRQANAPDFGLLAVNGSGDLGLQGVTISGGGTRGGASNSGKLNIQSSIISGNVGRGISNFNGSLTIANSTIVSNTAGGIYSRYGTLTIENSTISGNTDNYFGGGVSTSGGIIVIANSIISGNSTKGFGGGLSNGIGYGDGNPILLTITNSTISGNTAKNGGGGVSNYGGTIAIVNSTISNNDTEGQGGGLSNGIGYGGPGLFTIANSTISGNRANEGGGVFNRQICFGALCASAAVTLNHSLIAGNEAASGREIANQSNNFTANSFNLFGSNGNAGVTGFTPGPTDIVPSVSLAQILAPLNNNGGPTDTHALVVGSPAIDAGNPSGCRDNAGKLLPTDQRGFLRPADGNNDGTVRCDIGSLEFNSLVPPSISISDVTVTEGNGGTVNATFEVKLSEPSTQPVTVTFSTANRTAIAGIDFQGTSGTVTFNPGETTKTITVAVNTNTILELNKSFLVNLTSATNAFIGDGQAVGTIINDDGALPQRLSNISTRGGVLTGNNAMIGGFIVDGSASKRVLVRSRGPSMSGAPFLVPGTLANPFVQVFSGQTVIAQNDNWQDPPTCFGFVCEGATEIVNLGFDPCAPNPGQTLPPPSCALESAILITLPPGAYTAIVSGADGRTGVGLVEVFEADARTLSELSNISARGFVQSGDNVMIGGVIIEGTSPGTVLIRARGPSMSGAPFFVPGTLANPFLRLFSGQTVIAQNDNWQDAPNCPELSCGDAAQIAATSLDPCQPNPGQSTSPPGCAQESAMLITLPPGAYTAIVSGVGGGTGVGLVEVFEVD